MSSAVTGAARHDRAEEEEPDEPEAEEDEPELVTWGASPRAPPAVRPPGPAFGAAARATALPPLRATVTAGGAAAVPPGCWYHVVGKSGAIVRASAELGSAK
eukprot:gene26431-18199_t